MLGDVNVNLNLLCLIVLVIMLIHMALRSLLFNLHVLLMAVQVSLILYLNFSGIIANIEVGDADLISDVQYNSNIPEHRFEQKIVIYRNFQLAKQIIKC